MTQSDLFSQSYPETPGFADTDTSRDAAKAVRPKASCVREMVLEALRGRPGTAVQIALRLRLPYESVQPRTSELRAMGLVEDSGKRGPSRDPEKLAIIWRVMK